KNRQISAAKEQVVEDFKKSFDFEKAMWAYKRSLYHMARYHSYQMLTSGLDGKMPKGFDPESLKGLSHCLEGFAIEVPPKWDIDAEFPPEEGELFPEVVEKGGGSRSETVSTPYIDIESLDTLLPGVTGGTRGGCPGLQPRAVPIFLKKYNAIFLKKKI